MQISGKDSAKKNKGLPLEWKGTEEKAGSFEWKSMPESYVEVYERLDEEFNGVYSQSARALCDMAGLRPGQTVVDLGCGTGTSTGIVLEAISPGGRLFGMDINPRMLGRARMKFGDVENVTLIHGDMAGVYREMKERGLAGRIDCLFSSFSYFYMYDFHEALQRDIFNLLRPGGCLAFNVGTFRWRVECKGRVYNDYTAIYDEALDFVLRDSGYPQGIGEGSAWEVPSIFSHWDLNVLREAGYAQIRSEAWPMPMPPSDVYRYSIEGFGRFGMRTGSETLMGLDLPRRVEMMVKALERCAERMDRSGQRSYILNVVAVKSRR